MNINVQKYGSKIKFSVKVKNWLIVAVNSSTMHFFANYFKIN